MCSFLYLHPQGATYATDVHKVDGMELLREGYCVVMLDDRHRRRYVEILRNEDSG